MSPLEFEIEWKIMMQETYDPLDWMELVEAPKELSEKHKTLIKTFGKMEHKRYASIERNKKTGNIEPSKFIVELKEALEAQGETNRVFVATEKVHGCNLSFHYDGTEFRAARRGDFITEKDGFYGNVWVELLEQHKVAMEEIFTLFPEANKLSLYGELAGGNLKSDKKPNAVSIQSEIEYAGHNFFYIFDIAVDDEWLSWAEMAHICDSWGLLYAKELARGSFDEMSTFSANDLKSWIPKKLGYDIESPVEGAVIREITGDKLFYGRRIIFKIIADDFDEDKGKAKVKAPKSAEVLELEALGNELGESKLSVLRINKLYGNHGIEHEKKSIGKYTKLLIEDIMKEWLDQDGMRDYFEGLSDKHQRVIKSTLGKKCSRFYMNKILEM